MLFAESLFSLKSLSIAKYIRKKILKKLYKQNKQNKQNKAKKQCRELPLKKDRIEHTK